MARRKRLLSLKLLKKGNKLLDMGVPMTKVHIMLELEGKWSYQSTADIFSADRQDLYSVTRPEWLQDSPDLQETPTNWQFEGTFPYGGWINVVKG